MAMDANQPLRAAVYTRISDLDEKVDKTEVQEKRLRALVSKAGFDLLDVYTDDGISGWTGKARSDWDRLRSDISLGKIDVVFTDRQDRFSRSSLDTEAFKLLCVQNKVTWQFSNGSKINPADYMDAAMASFIGVFAQMESDIKKERLRARYEDETMKGNSLWGTRPFGYTSARDGKVVPKERDLILGAYQVILDGGTLYEIAKAWNAQEIPTTRGNSWSYQTVRQLLLRPRNAGLVVRDGVVQAGITGNWEALVSAETLADARAILESPARRTAPGRKPRYLCSGLIHCGVCGGPMRSSVATVRGVSIPIYRCASKLGVSTDKIRHTAVAISQLDPMVTDAIVSAFLFGTGNITPRDKRIDTAPLHKERAAVGNRKQELRSLVTMGLSTVAEIASDLRLLTKQYDDLTAQLKVAADESAQESMRVDLRVGLFDDDRAIIEEAASAKAQLRERFKGLELKQKRELVASLLDITIRKGRKEQRIEIVHTVVKSLNAPADPAEV